MNIRLKPLEELNFPQPVPWYVHEAFQNVDIEVEDAPVKKQERYFWKMKKGVHNWIMLKAREQFLSNRMKLKLENNQLDTVFIEFHSTNVDKMINRNFNFLLKEEEILL